MNSNKARLGILHLQLIQFSGFEEDLLNGLLSRRLLRMIVQVNPRKLNTLRKKQLQVTNIVKYIDISNNHDICHFEIKFLFMWNYILILFSKRLEIRRPGETKNSNIKENSCINNFHNKYLIVSSYIQYIIFHYLRLAISKKYDTIRCKN